MGGPVQQYYEGAATVGGCGDGSETDGSYGAGTGDDIQGGGLYSATV